MSDPYPKINSMFKRDQKGKMLWGQFSTPEIEYLEWNTWDWTEKVDGTNIRMTFTHDGAFRGNEFAYVQGRTDNAQIPPFLLDRCVRILQAAPFEEVFPIEGFQGTGISLYGEGYGARIQKGGGQYIPDGCDFVLFDVKIGDLWLRRDDVVDIGGKLGIGVVPLVFSGPLAETVEDMKAGFASAWLDAKPEGLVGRPRVELFDRRGDRIMTKIKYKDFM